MTSVAVAAPRIDPGRCRRDRGGLHVVHGASHDRRWHAALRTRVASGRAARLAQAVEAPRRAKPGRSDHEPSRRLAANAGCLDTAGGSRRSGCSRRRSRSPRTRHRVYAAADRIVEGADWVVWRLTGVLRAERLRRGLQGHVAQAARATPSRSTSRPSGPDSGICMRRRCLPLSCRPERRSGR